MIDAKLAATLKTGVLPENYLSLIKWATTLNSSKTVEFCREYYPQIIKEDDVHSPYLRQFGIMSIFITEIENGFKFNIALNSQTNFYLWLDKEGKIAKMSGTDKHGINVQALTLFDKEIAAFISNGGELYGALLKAHDALAEIHTRSTDLSRSRAFTLWADLAEGGQIPNAASFPRRR